MFKKKKILAVIPARSGSKGIKNKNIQILNKKPLFIHSAEYAIKSKIVDKVVISTDSKKYIKIAKKYSFDAPFVRPKKYSGDYVEDYDVIYHALRKTEKYYTLKFDYIILLRPTSPFREKNLIEKGVKLINDNLESDSVRSVITVNEHPYRMWVRGKKYISGLIDSVFEPYNKPRQKLPKIYFQSGDIEIIKRSTLLKGTISGKKVLPLLIKNKSIDIDSVKDLKDIKKNA